MDRNTRLYTREADGTIATWYLDAWCGPRFSVSPKRNAKMRDFKKYYHMDDVGKLIFLSRKEAETCKKEDHNEQGNL